jgi:signal transduction histidine kinase
MRFHSEGKPPEDAGPASIPDWLPALLIGGLGLSILLLAARHLFSELADLDAVALPAGAFLLVAGLALGLLAVGWWIRSTPLAPADRWQIAGWCYAGTAALLVLQALTLVIRAFEGRPVSDPTFIILANAGAGGLLGAFVGVRTAVLARRERELERRTDRLDSFASVVSHDLRNPLNVAQGRLELARGAVDDATDGGGAGDEGVGGGGSGADADGGWADELRFHLADAADSLDRMAALIDELLTLARADDPVTETTPVSLTDVARRCWADVPTGAAGLTVADDLTVLADEARLRQLLENIFRNSVEHGSTGSRSKTGDAVEHGSTEDRSGADGTGGLDSDGGESDTTVTVTVGPLPDRSGFYVADDGPGVFDAERGRVFEPGYSTADDGTGFGLAIVRDIAAAHGWEVTVTDADGGGARFEFGGVRTGEDGAGAGGEVGDGAFGGE